jgi:hypothetical protein
MRIGTRHANVRIAREGVAHLSDRLTATFADLRIHFRAAIKCRLFMIENINTKNGFFVKGISRPILTVYSERRISDFRSNPLV